MSALASPPDVSSLSLDVDKPTTQNRDQVPDRVGDIAAPDDSQLLHFTHCLPRMDFWRQSSGVGHTLYFPTSLVSPCGIVRYLPERMRKSLVLEILKTFHEQFDKFAVTQDPDQAHSSYLGRIENRQGWEDIISRGEYKLSPNETIEQSPHPPNFVFVTPNDLEPLGLGSYGAIAAIPEPHQSSLAYSMEHRRGPSARGWCPRFAATDSPKAQFALVNKTESEAETRINLSIEISPTIDDFEFDKTQSDGSVLLMTRVEIHEWLERYIAELRTRNDEPQGRMSNVVANENPTGMAPVPQVVFSRGSEWEASNVVEDKQRYIFREIDWSSLASRRRISVQEQETRQNSTIPFRSFTLDTRGIELSIDFYSVPRPLEAWELEHPEIRDPPAQTEDDVRVSEEVLSE